jgi:hypothetical protein
VFQPTRALTPLVRDLPDRLRSRRRPVLLPNGIASMLQEPDAPRPDTRLKFLRVLGTVWLIVVVLTLGGMVVVPHLGQVTDFVLHQTSHRQWTRLTFDAERPFFDLSTPIGTVQSYYSALYQGNVAGMARLTQGALREQMRLRVAHATSAPAFTPYRSFVRADMRGDHEAVVLEKFHLFWQRGLRFVLQREAGDWQIVGIEPVP